MKKNLTATIAVVLFSVLFIAAAADAGTKIAVEASLSNVKGKVEVLKLGASSWINWKQGLALHAGDTVRTGDDGNCLIKWGKNNVIKMTPLSNIKLGKMEADLATASSNTQLDFNGGKAYFKAKKAPGKNSSFEVKTPTAVAGVRGTSFSANVTGGGGQGAIPSGPAKLSSVAGTVEIQRAGDSGWKAAVNGMSLGTGDKVKTGKNGSCVVTWGKGSAARIKHITVFEIGKMDPSSNSNSATSFNVSSGKAYFKAKKGDNGGSFEVKTPSAVAGVRGTKFSIGLAGSENSDTGGDPTQTEIQCSEGELEVKSDTGNGAPMIVKSGEKANLKQGAPPPPPVKLTKEEADSFNKDSKLDEIKPDEPKKDETKKDDSKKDETAKGGDQGKGNDNAGGNKAGGDNNQQPPAGGEGAKNEQEAKGGDGHVETEFQCADGEITVKAAGDKTGAEVPVKAGEKMSVGDTQKPVDQPKKMSDQEKKAITEATADMTVKQEEPETKKAPLQQQNQENAGGAAASGSSNGTLSLTISAPSDGLITNKSSITVSGSTSQNADVSINDSQISSGKTSFSGTVSLNVEGDNQITVTAKSGDLSTSSSIKVVKKTTVSLNVTQPPSLFDMDKNGCSIISDTQIQCVVIGTTDPGATVYVNGKSIPVNGGGGFNQQITLDMTATSIKVEVRDSLGNTATPIILTRTLDPARITKLFVEINPPSVNAGDHTPVTVTVTGKNILNALVNGTPVSISATGGGTLDNGLISPQSLPLQNGIAKFTFTPGNQFTPGSVPGPSTIKITASPTDGGVTGSATLTVTHMPPSNPK